MESLRNFLKSWPGRIFLLLCLSPLALLGIESYFFGSSNLDQIAVVGDESVTLSDYQNAINNRRHELLEAGIDASQINEAVLREEVLQLLIDRALLRQQVNKLGMTVSDETITRLLRQEPRFMGEDGTFSNDRFAYFLRQQGITKEQLFQQFREQLSLVQLNASIVGTAIYPMAEISRLLDLQEESRQMFIHRFNWQDFADQVSITDADITAYYHEHKNELKSQAMVDLDYLAISPASIDVGPVTEEDIKAQYEAFKQRNNAFDNRQISQILLTGDDAEKQIQTLKARLDKGEKFSDLAKEYSDDPVSAAQGGSIGTFNPDIFGQDANAVAQVIEGLEIGEISEPVKTTFGYQLFTVTKNDVSVPSLESMREQLQAEALNYKRAEAYADKVTQINDLVVDGYGLQDIAQQENVKIQQIKDYTKTDNNSVLNQPTVITAAFDEFTLQDQGVSPSIDVGESTVWVQPTNYRPVAPLNLEQATPIIKSQLVQQKASALALQKAEEVAKQVTAQGMDSTSVSFDNLGMVNRQSPILSQEEKTVAFTEDTQPGKLLALAQATEMGASVLVVDAIDRQSKQQISDEQKQRTAGIIRDNQGQTQLQDYIEYLRTVTKVEINEPALESANGS
ncbi:SurA N-terminal domain-containing protein [Psychrobacter sp. I-STPA6b]|uniref:SurA N-terminal domain-containing protein n=1 Tax=Psychrobacter sp. I-STPA6b TaxID=2585718 RepID=UPI001D0C7B12|nr:SurA N-terminal domain-containing protein [Psychrobacter sp. I-STPA6b]